VTSENAINGEEFFVVTLNNLCSVISGA